MSFSTAKRYEITDRIIEYGIYLYIVLMFVTKGEGIRNLIIFGNFALWLSTLQYRKNLHLLRHPVSQFCWIYLAIIPVSVIFSLDPLSSLKELKDEPLKFAALFPVIATVMTQESRLRNFTVASLFSLLIIVLSGYYSYIFHNIQLMKPDTALVHAWHNKFARYINTLLPFVVILYFVWKKLPLKIFLTVSVLISVSALVLSTSRGGYAAFFSIVCIWIFFLSRKEDFNVRRAVMVLIPVLLVIGLLSWNYSPFLKKRISNIEDIYTVNLRSESWHAALQAVKERPLTGWGYGSRIFHQDEPYKNTSYGKKPVDYEMRKKKLVAVSKGPHNTFLKVLFGQGLTGLIPYVFLIFISIKYFSKEALRLTGIRSYILVACISVLAGNFIVHSMLEVLKLQYLAVLIGTGMAAKGMNENSHT